ncbi:MAG: ABC transporter ATP-binding protein [Candidatus Paceibacterota bacterium]
MNKTINEKENTIPKTPWRFFVYSSKPHKIWAFSAIFLVIIASSVGSGTSYIFKLIVDAAEKGDTKSAMFWGVVLPLTLFVIQATYRLSGFVAANWTTKTAKTAVDTVNSYIFKHSHSYYSNRFAGSISSKLRNIIGAVDEIIPDFLWAQLASFVGFLVTFSLIFSVDGTSSFLFIILIFVLYLTNKKLAPEKTRLSKISSEANTLLGGGIIDRLTNISAVRQYTKYEQEINDLKELTDKRRIAHKNNWFYTEKLLIINTFILFTFSFSIFWLVTNKWSLGEISTGDFVMVAALIFNISGSLIFIGRAFNAMAKTIGELQEALDDLLVNHEIVDVKDATDMVVNNGRIDWNDVSFQFENNEVFTGFNLSIEGGQRVGLVGSSGAGKSTFVSLLLRQHDVDSGLIKIDGQDISKVTQDSLRQNIAVVPQEPALFHRTIRENIAYGNTNATDEEIIEVAKQAHAHEFISKLSEGYDTLVGERGVKLSGGQKQRVAIARAMLKNAPILILDEATSALDSESEILIQKALHNLMEGKTVIAIAHRLSTLREMDRIIVLEEGKIIEDGKHTELKDANGVYAKLWQHQSGGFLLD